MRLRISSLFPLLPLALLAVHAADEPKHTKPCTVTSPNSGLFFDLSSLAVSPPDKAKAKDARDESWLAKGHDYGVNFTMNFCAPVVEDIKDVVGVDKEEWRNVSAFYTKNDKIYSIGFVALRSSRPAPSNVSQQPELHGAHLSRPKARSQLHARLTM